MRKIIRLTLLIALTGFGFSAFAGVIIIEGNYQGKNLYVQNPFAGSGVGFCVTKVLVNGSVTTDEYNSSAFEIDFTNHQLKIGDKVEVKIEHKDDCKPKVLNPEVLKPKSTYEVTTMTSDPDGTIKWKTKGEQGKLPFIVEQYRWNKWVKVGEVDGIGTPGENSYSFKVSPHYGENKVRIKQVDYTSTPRYSRPVTFTSNIAQIKCNTLKTKDFLIFEGGETMYEIFDKFGNMVKKGYGAKVDVSNLKADVYYLNYDNTTTEFIKKK
ncbi:MAG: hypothetical protein IT233_00420 [Bacteroidia bacterium]|nr:hypothetical protein [Bacteroidia bacterium]